MKILYTNFHPHAGGGHTTYLLSLAQALRGRHEIHVAAPAGSTLNRLVRQQTEVEVKDIDFPGKIKELGGIISNAVKLRRLIRSNQYDIIHVNGSPDHRLVVLACAGLKNRPAIIFTKHNSFALSKKRLSQNRYRLHTDHVILVCGCQRQMFLDIGIPQERMTVIKNGVDTAHYKAVTEQSRQEARAALGLPQDSLILASAAGTDLHKGWSDLVEAVSKINDRAIRIIIVGTMPDKDVLAYHVQRLGMADRVIFPGLVMDVRPYIAAGDIGFVLSSNVETISFACRETMAMGLPVLVTKYACLPENIDPGEDGWVVEVGDIAAIQKQVEWALSHRELLPPMGEKARRRAVSEFDLSIFVSQTESVYEKVLGQRRIERRKAVRYQD